jgi:hypothetical protein
VKEGEYCLLALFSLAHGSSSADFICPAGNGRKDEWMDT